MSWFYNNTSLSSAHKIHYGPMCNGGGITPAIEPQEEIEVELLWLRSV